MFDLIYSSETALHKIVQRFYIGLIDFLGVGYVPEGSAIRVLKLAQIPLKTS